MSSADMRDQAGAVPDADGVDVAPGHPDALNAILEALHVDGDDTAAALLPVRDRQGTVDFEFVAATSNTGPMFGVSGVVGRRLTEVLPASLLAEALEAGRRVHETGQAARRAVTFPARPGAPARHGEVVRVRSRGFLVVLWHDLTELHRARERLESSQRRSRALIEHSQDLILVLAADRRVLYASPAVSRVMRVPPEEFAGHRWGEAAHPDDRERVLALFDRVVAADPGEVVTGQFRVSAPDGRVRWMEMRAVNHLDSPEIAGIVLNVQDVTERREAELALQQQALQDSLTGLPNRRWFLDAARRGLARAERLGRTLAVLLVDLDDFKVVNDSLGHPAGDRLLVEVAARMSAALRPADSVARLGGDEFVVLAEGLADARDAVVLAERLLEAASGLYDLGGGLRTRVGLSIGVCTAAPGTDPDTLLAHADAALYEAKRRGRRRVELFDPGLRDQVLERLHTEHGLRAALERDELDLHWQPLVEVGTGRVVAAEALLRWRHPERGLLLPGAFLRVAEQSGLMPAVCERVLENAMSQAAVWSRLPGSPRVFVNLGGTEMGESGLADLWAGSAARHGVDPSSVVAEVSERLLPGDVASVAAALGRLREQGFGVALDDFGAGNTALAWLQQLPLDLLKLDRRFTAELGDPATRAIVQAVLGLAPALGFVAVAEGVESAEQLAALRALECGLAQGYSLGRPQPAEALTALLGG